MSQSDVVRLASEVDRARKRLHALLRSKDARALARRPAAGEWSIMENVRHLLFAEQAHLGKFLPDGFEWSRVGLTQRTGKAFADVGTDPTEDVEEVFRSWDAIHRPIGKALRKGDEAMQYALERHLKHLVHHITVIEKLLRKPRT